MQEKTLVKNEIYMAWLRSMSGSPLTGEGMMLLKPFLSHNQMYPFIRPLKKASNE